MASEENSICENGKLTGKLIFLWHFWNTSNYCLIDSSCRRLSGHYLVHSQFISVFNYFASVSRILIFVLYSQLRQYRAFSVFFCIKLSRYLVRFHFSPVFCCYITISRIVIFLFYSIVTFISHKCNNNQRYNKNSTLFRHVTSLFSPVIDCKVSISRILCFPMWSIVTWVSRAFFLFSHVMDC